MRDEAAQQEVHLGAFVATTTSTADTSRTTTGEPTENVLRRWQRQ